MDSGILIDAIDLDTDIGTDNKVCGCISFCLPEFGQASIELIVE